MEYKKDSPKACLWCGNMIMVHQTNIFPVHGVCSQIMRDKKVNFSLYSEGKREEAFYIVSSHRRLRILLAPGDIGRKVWAKYEYHETPTMSPVSRALAKVEVKGFVQAPYQQSVTRLEDEDDYYHPAHD